MLWVENHTVCTSTVHGQQRTVCCAPSTHTNATVRSFVRFLPSVWGFGMFGVCSQADVCSSIDFHEVGRNRKPSERQRIISIFCCSSQSVDGRKPTSTHTRIITSFYSFQFSFEFSLFCRKFIGNWAISASWIANTKNYHFYSTKSIQEWQIFHSRFAFFLHSVGALQSNNTCTHTQIHSIRSSHVEHTSISSSLFPQREVAKHSSTLPTAECRVSARTPTKLFSAPNNERNVVLHTSREVVPPPSFVGYSKIELRFKLKLSSVVVRTNIYFMAIATCCISCLPSRIEGSWNSLAGLKFHIHACKTPSERFCCIFIGIGFECSGNSSRSPCTQTPTNIGWLTVCVCIGQKSFLFASFGEALPRDGCRRCRIYRCVSLVYETHRWISVRAEENKRARVLRVANEMNFHVEIRAVVGGCLLSTRVSNDERGLDLQNCRYVVSNEKAVLQNSVRSTFSAISMWFRTSQMHTASVDSGVFVWESMKWKGSG